MTPALPLLVMLLVGEAPPGTPMRAAEGLMSQVVPAMKIGADEYRTTVLLDATNPTDAARLRPVLVAMKRMLEAQGAEAWVGNEGQGRAARFLLTVSVTGARGSERLNVTCTRASNGESIAQGDADAPDDLKGKGTSADVSHAGQVDAVAARLASALAQGVAQMPDGGRYARVAVVPFQERGAAARDARAGEAIAIQVEKLLLRKHRVIIADRRTVQKVVAQQGTAQALGDDKAGELGQLLDAQALVMGEVSESGDRFMVQARLVSVETGEVLAAGHGTMKRGDVVSLSDGMLEFKSRPAAAFRSVVFPGWGQIYMGDTVKGVLAMAATLGLVVTSVVALLVGATLHASYIAFIPNVAVGPLQSPLSSQQLSSASTPLRTAATVGYVVAAVVGAVAAMSWVVNVADAYAFGSPG